MSVHAMKWAWAQQVGNPTRKLVLLALADHANSDGECWPTMRRVAQVAQRDGRTVQRHIDKLEADGYVEKVERRVRSDGTFGQWSYRLAIPPETDTSVVSGGHECPPDTTDTETGTADVPGQARADKAVSSGHQCPADTALSAQNPQGLLALTSKEADASEPAMLPFDGSANGQAEPSEHGRQDEPEPDRLLKQAGWWLRERHGVDVGEKPSVYGIYDAVLRGTLTRVPDKKQHGIAMGLVCEFWQLARGDGLTQNERKRIGKLLKGHQPAVVLQAVSESVDWGAGESEEYADDEKASVNYVTRVVQELEKQGAAS